MHRTRSFHCALSVVALLLLSACAGNKAQPFDYSAYKANMPKSILVLPPVNQTPDVRATFSMLAQVSKPLAESGYYVLPVTLVHETLQENGISEATLAHGLPASKLRDIFAADAALYITMTRYGTVYQVIDSNTTVAAQAKLIDLKTEQVLWTGSAMASTAEQQNQQQGGLAVLLITALVKQIAGSLTEQSHPMAGVTSQRLLSAGRPNGMLFGPRSPRFGQETPP